MTDTGARDTGPAAEVDRLRSTITAGRTRSRSWRTRQLRGLGGMLADREGELVAAPAGDPGRPAVDARPAAYVCTGSAATAHRAPVVQDS